MRESYLKVDIRKNVKVDPRKNVWYVRVILEINAIHFGDSNSSDHISLVRDRIVRPRDNRLTDYWGVIFQEN